MKLLLRLLLLQFNDFQGMDLLTLQLFCKLQILIYMMTENIDEEPEYVNKSHISNQLRSNQIRNKKSSLPQDREQLYAENIELKSKIRQLMELNLKLKTQLSINQKEKVNLCNIAEQELFHPKLGNRSHTGHKKSVTNIIANQQNGQSLFNNPLQKEKQSIAFKKIVRDQNIEMQKLNNEIQRLKKTIKYTRMNEILAQNSQLLNETLRLKDIIAEMKQNENRVYSDFAIEVENLRKKLNNEKDSEKRNGFELKKQLETNLQLKDKLNQIESKKIDLEKRLNKEIKQYKNEITELKTKLLEYVPFKGKECEREQCVRNRKEKVQLKKKNQSYQKQVKKLQAELQQKLKLLHAKDLQNKKVQPNSSIPKTPENKEKSNSHVKKDESKSKEIQNKHGDTSQQRSFLEEQSKKKEKIENKIHKSNQKIQEPSHKSKPEKQDKKVLSNAKEHGAKEKVGEKRKTQQKNDSMDTQKLLKSQQSQEENTQIQSASLMKQVNKKQKDKSSQPKEKQQKLAQQMKNKLAQSDGQYENLDYDQFQNEQVQNEKKKKQEKKKKSQKQTKVDKQKNTIEEDKSKKQIKKTKQKSAKKLQQPAKNKDDQEEILYSGEKQKEAKQPEGDKEELKLMRDTLIYKFMAQNYSFQNFCNDINSSEMKQFSITDIMNLLNGQPFLLHDEQIQLIIIYLFDTNKPTGEQSLGAKEFMKKMKKFIGKAKAVNEEQQTSNIQQLSEIILRDEQGEKKMRKKWTEMDAGVGSITVEQFKKVMTSFKVKDALLQTAISQITYISQDLNHLNYDFFLKRFLQAEN